MKSNTGANSIRKIVTWQEDTLIEGFRQAEKPWRMFAVAAIVANPWAGRYVEDLKPGILETAPDLGELLTARILEMAGDGDAIEVYGKAAVVGLDGEIEHGFGHLHQ